MSKSLSPIGKQGDEQMSEEEKKQGLEEIAREIRSCRRCPLWEMATNAVPGEGNPDADLLFIGEAPGFHEDRQGRPFVGRAGQLLERSLEEIGLSRADVYICNMIKHRPPGNRDPEPGEIRACLPWLNRQIEVVDPKVIVTLGRFSMAHFIPEAKISRVHGQARLVRSRLVLPLYHPAAALRSALVMGEFKDDFAEIPHLLDRADDLLAKRLPSGRGVEADADVAEEQLTLI
jgi:DNA polymerase